MRKKEKNTSSCHSYKKKQAIFERTHHFCILFLPQNRAESDSRCEASLSSSISASLRSTCTARPQQCTLDSALAERRVPQGLLSKPEVPSQSEAGAQKENAQHDETVRDVEELRLLEAPLGGRAPAALTGLAPSCFSSW
ncbi:unnamed protein product [Pleuronectes platessa]|uniref:Uncharacterized protein n=1 Tax=Pleuronectes platessa TaxID=8262 RepID=A0A9N7TGD3_PLEPL|nr:unnamed protein product [Pleuronectes platessa]